MSSYMHQEGRPQPVAIGIDFGTSKCCVAAVRDGRAHVLENEFGQRTTPSWVAFNSQQRLVGGAALDQAVVNCANTVSAVKRTLGRTYDDVKGLSSATNIRKDSNSGTKFKFIVQYKKNERMLNSEQVAAMLLRQMKSVAESSLGCSVDRAVISVPVSFSNSQRIAITNAAAVADLKVLQLINESTAAAITFQNNRTDAASDTILVVDFGAGKLEMSIMEIRKNCVQVIASAGNSAFGGQDIDDMLVKYLIQQIEETQELVVERDAKTLHKIRLACEKAKITLTLLNATFVLIENVGDGIDAKLHLTRETFNSLVRRRLRAVIKDIHDRLFEKQTTLREKISKVVLVGGSTRIPVVQTTIRNYFGPRKFNLTVNQDEAVAEGAALQAAALLGDETKVGTKALDIFGFDLHTQVENERKNVVLADLHQTIPCIKEFDVTEKLAEFSKIFERVLQDGAVNDYLIIRLRSEMVMKRLVPGHKATLKLSINQSGLCSADVILNGEVHKDLLKFAGTISSQRLSEWKRDEHEFQYDVMEEFQRVDAEVNLELLCFDLIDKLRCFQENFPSSQLEDSHEICASVLEWLSTEESPPVQRLSIQTEKLLKIKEKLGKMADHGPMVGPDHSLEAKSYDSSSLSNETQEEAKPELENGNSKLTATRELVRRCVESNARVLERYNSATYSNDDDGTSVDVFSISERTKLSGKGFSDFNSQEDRLVRNSQNQLVVQEPKCNLETTSCNDGEGGIQKEVAQEEETSLDLPLQANQTVELPMSQTGELVRRSDNSRMFYHRHKATTDSSISKQLDNVQSQHRLRSSLVLDSFLEENQCPEVRSSAFETQAESIHPSNRTQTEDARGNEIRLPSGKLLKHLCKTEGESLHERLVTNDHYPLDKGFRKTNGDTTMQNQASAGSCTNVSHFVDAGCQTRLGEKTDTTPVVAKAVSDQSQLGVCDLKCARLDSFSNSVMTCNICSAINSICLSHSQEGFNIFRKLDQLKSLLCLPLESPH